jgi:hypothetical protein
MSTRGVNEYMVEKICQCKCHNSNHRTRHFIPCCHEPRTKDGEDSLESYNDKLLVKKDKVKL